MVRHIELRRIPYQTSVVPLVPALPLVYAVGDGKSLQPRIASAHTDVTAAENRVPNSLRDWDFDGFVFARIEANGRIGAC